MMSAASNGNGGGRQHWQYQRQWLGHTTINQQTGRDSSRNGILGGGSGNNSSRGSSSGNGSNGSNGSGADGGSGNEGPAGITLTDNFAMLPTSAVSGFYFGHRDSQYFGVARIGMDQVEDYAARRRVDLAQAERWLRPNLD